MVLILSGSGSSAETRFASDLGLIQDVVHGPKGWTSEIIGIWVTVLGLGPVLKETKHKTLNFLGHQS